MLQSVSVPESPESMLGSKSPVCFSDSECPGFESPGSECGLISVWTYQWNADAGEKKREQEDWRWKAAEWGSRMARRKQNKTKIYAQTKNHLKCER